MKRVNWLLVVLAVTMIFGLGVYSLAAEKAKETVSGKPSCGGCSGTVKGCCVQLTDANGDRWILRGKSESLKAAFKARHGDKEMTATMAGKPVAKKDADGKAYKEVQVSDVKIKS